MKRYSWKYIAGLVDGEGCIDMQGSRDKRDGKFYCSPRFRMTLSGEAGNYLLPQFHSNFGGSVKIKPRKFENPNWQDAYTWCIVGKKQLRKFLQNIFNHLYIKKEQAKFCLWWINNIQGKHQVTEEVRRCAIEELKAMKRDPHRLSDSAVHRIYGLMRQSGET